mmetsp:Transcript_35540/g.92641  ORF Transcript_35540/g.92641 Transcript_35540/m.92641 type:complete len:298 (+) Transcript_35540:849-1742(+)
MAEMMEIDRLLASPEAEERWPAGTEAREVIPPPTTNHALITLMDELKLLQDDLYKCSQVFDEVDGMDEPKLVEGEIYKCDITYDEMLEDMDKCGPFDAKVKREGMPEGILDVTVSHEPINAERSDDFPFVLPSTPPPPVKIGTILFVIIEDLDRYDEEEFWIRDASNLIRFVGCVLVLQIEKADEEEDMHSTELEVCFNEVLDMAKETVSNCSDEQGFDFAASLHFLFDQCYVHKWNRWIRASCAAEKEGARLRPPLLPFARPTTQRTNSSRSNGMVIKVDRDAFSKFRQSFHLAFD